MGYQLSLEKRRYTDAIMCVAMVIAPKQWKALQTPDFSGQNPRTEVFEIQKCTLSQMMELEIQWGVRMNSKGKDRSKLGMNSLGICFSGVRKKNNEKV